MSLRRALVRVPRPRPHRWLQHAAFVAHRPSDPPQLHSGVRPNPSARELARRVEALVIPVPTENDVLSPSPSSRPLKRVPSDSTYSEEELLAIYDDLLALSQDESHVTTHSTSQDKAVVESIVSRISPSILPSETLSTLLQQRAEQASPREKQPHPYESRPSLPHHVALSLLHPIIRELQSAPNVPASSSGKGPQPANEVSPAVLSLNEWRSLTRVCLAHEDLRSVKMTFELMMASGIQPAEDQANDVLEWYARRGDVSGLEEFLQEFVRGSLTDRQRHLHIKAHEKSVPPGAVPESALSLLHTYESTGRPPPMTAYSRLIAALFRIPSSVAHAQAWDLFSHMRYVAHPHPDSLLYSQMIQACALPTPSEPERALDLFTEMTIDRRIPPTAGAYTAAILACARSGSKVYVNEAFRLAKEMLNAHRDARGRSAFSPDSHTFGALLEGAKRIGDLGRVRWILAEMVEMTRRNPESRDVVVDERIMTHVFHAYAAYKPPFRRSMAPLASQNKVDADTSEPVESFVADDREPSPPPPVEVPQEPSFAHLPPQSRPEVIGEARALFARISRPSPPPTGSPSGAPLLPALPDVHVTPRLLRAYLSIFYAHAPLETAHGMFRTTFADHGLTKDVVAIVEALERCAAARRGVDRARVGSFADDAWNEWTTFEKEKEKTPIRGESSARSIQRAYAARIRVLALTGRLDEALACLRTFSARYPPHAVLEPSRPRAERRNGMRDMRVSLAAGGRPLVRLTTVLDVQDDDVPAFLTFADVEVLHHRLVAAGDLRGLAYVKWACKAYEGALRKRREAALRA